MGADAGDWQTEAVAQTALGLLDDREQLQQMRLALRELVRPIVKPGAAANVTAMIREMLPRY